MNEIIQKVIDRIAPKYTFGHYDLDDIKQEAWIMCMEAMDKYDHQRPLENFLSKHLSNKLKTFRRDNYHRPNYDTKANESKRKLADLNMELMESDHPYYEIDFIEEMSDQEDLDIVMDNLSPVMRADFLKIANGAFVQQHKKAAVYEKVREILENR